MDMSIDYMYKPMFDANKRLGLNLTERQSKFVTDVYYSLSTGIENQLVDVESKVIVDNFDMDILQDLNELDMIR